MRQTRSNLPSRADLISHLSCVYESGYLEKQEPKKFQLVEFSLTELMVSHDLLRSTITGQIAFDQQDLESNPKSERPMDRCCKALVSKLETLIP